MKNNISNNQLQETEINPYTVLSGHSHSFDTGIAEKLGIECAIIFNYIVSCLRTNFLSNNPNLIDGKIWMYESHKKMAVFFGYLNEDQNIIHTQSNEVNE